MSCLSIPKSKSIKIENKYIIKKTSKAKILQNRLEETLQKMDTQMTCETYELVIREMQIKIKIHTSEWLTFRV